MIAGHIWREKWFLPAFVFSGFILLFSSLTISSFWRASPTYDESIHLFAGYSYLKWGDFRINPEHPPLAKILAALPLLALDVKDPHPSSPNWWVAAHQMVFLNNDAETLFFYAKLPLIALAIILGVFVYLWSQKLYGVQAAIVSLFVYCLDPNILAHSPIVHTDIPFTTFLFIGTYFFWKLLDELSWSSLCMTSLFFGLAAITKYSFLMILPVWGILGLLKIFFTESQSTIRIWGLVSHRGTRALVLAGVLICAAMTAYLFIWAAYGLRFEAFPGRRERLLPIVWVMPEKAFLQRLVSFSTQDQLFPEAWIYGFLYVAKFFIRPAYLLGQISDDGFWLYFPVAFAVKTPLPTLILLVASVGKWIFKSRDRSRELCLFIPVAVYFSLAVYSRLNIGLRHLLPIYPFLFVLIGGAAAELWGERPHVKRVGLILLGLWYLGSSVHIYPHYLAFFNELAGGAKNGYKVLTDSSLDWGQDLKGLKRWIDEHGVEKIQLAYFGTADPNYYGIDAVYLPGSIIFSSRPKNKSSEAPKYIAVSATYIYGVHSGKPLKEFYKPLRFRKPIATIGHSIFVYRLDSG